MAIDANVTLRRLIAEFKTWADAHEMIEKFAYGDFLEIYEDKTPNLYPYFMMNCNNGSDSQFYMKYTVEICVMDWVYDDRDNQKRVESDTDAIIRDLTNTIRWSNRWQQFSKLNGEPTKVKFIEKGGDKVTGWCYTLDLWIRKQSGFCNLENLLPEYDFETQTSVTPACDPATYKNSDSSFTQSIPSGDTFVAGDVTITINGNPNVIPSNKDVSFTVSGDPATNSMNGTELTDIPSGGDKDFTIRHEDDSPVVVTTVTDSATEFIGEIPNAAKNTSNLYKTGQVTSFRTGDDPTRGRGTDWWNIGFNNGFDNGKRFTGTTGGYQDEGDSLYYDKDGVLTTEALAFPDDITVDWSQWDQVGDTVYGFHMVAETADIWDDIIDLIEASSFAGFSDWFLMNKNEICVLSNDELSGGVPILFNYHPVNYDIDAQSKRLWTATTGGITTRAYYLVENGNIQNTNKTSVASAFKARIFTFTDLGL